MPRRDCQGPQRDLRHAHLPHNPAVQARSIERDTLWRPAGFPTLCWYRLLISQDDFKAEVACYVRLRDGISSGAVRHSESSMGAECLLTC